MKKNIILLALSTIGRIERREFHYGDDTFESWYQLESVPKKISSDLNKNGEELNEIIMLCTGAASGDKVPVEIKRGEDVLTPLHTTTALELFKDQMRNAVKPEHLSDEEFFKDIPVNEENPAKGLMDLTSYIRGKYGNEKDNVDIYMATNGGLRGTQRMLEAVLTLLKSEGFCIKDSYGTETRTSTIIKETNRLEIFDFVAGMKEFLETGKNNSLQKYLGDDDKLSAAIGKVADGIQWGNVGALETGLSELVPLLDKAQENPADTADKDANERQTYLAIFKDNIKRDYGRLIGPHDTLDEIEWCMNKNFYQMALTLLEARMFEDYLKWGIFRIKKEPDDHGVYVYEKRNGEEKKSVSVKKNELLNGMINTRADQRNGKGREAFKAFEKLSKTLGNKETDLENLTVDEDCYFDKIRAISHQFTCNYSEGNPVEIINPFVLGEFLRKNDEISQKFYILLAMHKNLKKVRNDMNHLVDPFPEPASVTKRLVFFLDLAKEIRSMIAEEKK